MAENASWQEYTRSTLRPRQDLENTSRWACGRPASQHMGGVDSDGDEFSHDMELEQLPLYSRYSREENDDDDDDEGGGSDGDAAFKDGFGAEMLTEAMSGMELGHGMFSGGPGGPGEDPWGDDDDDDESKAGLGSAAASAPRPGASAEASAFAQGMDDDEVLLANSDEEFPDSSSPDAGSKMLGSSLGGGGAGEGSSTGHGDEAGGEAWDDDQRGTSGAAGESAAAAVDSCGSDDAGVDVVPGSPGDDGAAKAGSVSADADGGSNAEGAVKQPVPSSWPLDVASEASGCESEAS